MNRPTGRAVQAPEIAAPCRGDHSPVGWHAEQIEVLIRGGKGPSGD
jgi:hypothetical protein